MNSTIMHMNARDADVGQLEAWVEDYAEPLGLVGHDDGSGQSYKTGPVVIVKCGVAFFNSV